MAVDGEQEAGRDAAAAVHQMAVVQTNGKASAAGGVKEVDVPRCQGKIDDKLFPRGKRIDHQVVFCVRLIQEACGGLQGLMAEGRVGREGLVDFARQQKDPFALPIGVGEELLVVLLQDPFHAAVNDVLDSQIVVSHQATFFRRCLRW